MDNIIKKKRRETFAFKIHLNQILYSKSNYSLDNKNTSQNKATKLPGRVEILYLTISIISCLSISFRL